MRRSDPRPYLFFHKRGGRIHILGLFRRLLWVTQRILWAGLIIIGTWINSQRKTVFGM